MAFFIIVIISDFRDVILNLLYCFFLAFYDLSDISLGCSKSIVLFFLSFLFLLAGLLLIFSFLFDFILSLRLVILRASLILALKSHTVFLFRLFILAKVFYFQWLFTSKTFLVSVDIIINAGLDFGLVGIVY